VARQSELFASSVVCLGSFNPRILTPDWLERHKLIGSQDAEAARSSPSLLITAQVAQFECSWFSLQVVENQFSFTSKGALTDAFKDLVFGVLSLLPQTPVTGLGMNFMAHYRLATSTEYQLIGDALAPKKIWRDLFSESDDHVGLTDLTVRVQKVQKDVMIVAPNHTNIQIQPSGLIPRGVFVLYNEHHDLLFAGKDSDLLPAVLAANLVDEQWETVYADSVRVMNGIIEKALESAPKPAPN